jgi:pimeloyl-ACP methyl ester carboxylesterase
MSDTLAASPAYDEVLTAMHRRPFEDGDQVGVPVTLVWGDADRLLLPQQAERARAQLTGAELAMVAGGGHFAHWDDPDAALRALLR